MVELDENIICNIEFITIIESAIKTRILNSYLVQNKQSQERQRSPQQFLDEWPLSRNALPLRWSYAVSTTTCKVSNMQRLQHWLCAEHVSLNNSTKKERKKKCNKMMRKRKEGRKKWTAEHKSSEKIWKSLNSEMSIFLWKWYFEYITLQPANGYLNIM